MTTIEHPSQAGHWYTTDGQPAYTYTNGKGEEKPTTLREARKLGLVPSVTTILKEAAKFTLEEWKQKQLLLSSLTLPKIEGESLDDFADRVIKDSKEEGEKARERGTQIHAWVQTGFETGGFSTDFLPLEGQRYYEVARREIDIKTGLYSWVCEQPFATDRYGGKVDLHHLIVSEYIIDIKTKDTPLEGIKTYDEHAMQLSAYREGLGLPNARCGILFVSTKDVSAKLVWIEEEKLKRGWAMFNALLEYWYAKTGL